MFRGHVHDRGRVHDIVNVRLLLALALLPVLGNSGAALEPCVKVRITNCYARTVNIAYGPVTLCAETRVTPDENHRYLETVWDYAPPDSLNDIANGADDPVQESDPFINNEQQNGAVGSSLRSLNGAEQPIRNDVKMHHLEGGTYVVTSTAYTDESRKKVCGRATARVTVR